MFPSLWEEMHPLAPRMYFGGSDVPPYLYLPSEGSQSLADLAVAIRSIAGGADSAGYIDDTGVHYHLRGNEFIHVDLSRDFIFVSQPRIDKKDTPSPWQVFRFLQEPVRRAMFIVQDRATYMEKTPGTLRLCALLDSLWAQERFLDARGKMIVCEEYRDKGLALIMKIYEEETCGTSSEMWEFWPAFSRDLMASRLGLQVHIIDNQ